jgi:small subunit ribosomal protein S10
MFVSKKKIRLQLKSFNSQKLLLASLRIVSFLEKPKTIIRKPISLPTNKRIYCLLRSPHINKTSREHFEIRSYSKIIEFFLEPSKVINFFIPTSVTLRFVYKN